ncbi:MAG: hypothetical protein OEU54_11725 [Gemmatimonadota bacterium]|nr:hypothetical protein [Gemmatimonadota bacterium]
MRVKTLTAVCSLALSFLLVLPGVALGQQRAVGELVGEINGALTQNPTSTGSYQISIDGSGKLVAEKSDGSGTFMRWEIYLEDVESVTQTAAGQVYLNCSEDVGRCARQTCDGVAAGFSGCVRGDGAARRAVYSDALELEYEYDTRAMRSLGEAFDNLMALGLGM